MKKKRPSVVTPGKHSSIVEIAACSKSQEIALGFNWGFCHEVTETCTHMLHTYYLVVMYIILDEYLHVFLPESHTPQ